MLRKLIERKEAEAQALAGHGTAPVAAGARMVSDTELFKQLGSKLKVVKASGN